MRPDVLGWIGGQGTRAVAALIAIGLAMPWLGAILRPYVGEAIFVLLCISFLRVDAEALRGYLRRPGLVLAATAWTSFAVPLVTGIGLLAGGVDTRSPELHLALMLQAIASPMMAAPAIAALMGLDATLVLASMVASTALIPFTAAAFAAIFIGAELSIPSLALGAKLAAMLVGSALVGYAIRRVVGIAAIERQAMRINGFNVLVLLVFVAALMGGIPGQVLDDPVRALGIAALAFVMYLLVLGITTLLFSFAGIDRALAVGFMVSQRNTGLMIAAVGGALPELAWLYFGFAQFPIYLSPQLLSPLVRRAVPAGGART